MTLEPLLRGLLEIAAELGGIPRHGDVYYLKGESYRVRGKERTELAPPATDLVGESPDGPSGS
jgi:hypothetical protein